MWARPLPSCWTNEVISAPVIRQAITGGSGQISGNFTVESSTELAVLLRAGALPAEMTFLEERTIGPELGADSIAAGELAALVAFAAVLVFMVLSYGLFGVFASVALILNVGLIFGVLSPDRGDADAAGDRGDRADHRHGGRRQRAGLRAHPRGDEDRQGAGPRDRAGL
jgi:protein-export membrane protein SecD